MTTNRVDLIQKAQIFAGLNDAELAYVASRVSLREFKRGQVILHEEDTNHYMYSVLTGEVKAFYSSEDGRESVVAFHGAGESFGEVSLIDQETIPATVAAVETSLVLLVGRDAFFEILFNQPKVMNRLLLLLAGRLRHSWSQIRMLHFKDAHYRLRAALLDLCEDRGEPAPEGVRIQLRLTHQTLADMTGLTRETVTRVLDKLKKSDLLSIDANRYMLLRHSFFEKNLSL